MLGALVFESTAGFSNFTAVMGKQKNRTLKASEAPSDPQMQGFHVRQCTCTLPMDRTDLSKNEKSFLFNIRNGQPAVILAARPRPKMEKLRLVP